MEFAGVAVLSFFLTTAPRGAAQSPIDGMSTTPSIVRCAPGLVYRCNKYGCFCVPPDKAK
jgi:hypothetical protein